MNPVTIGGASNLLGLTAGMDLTDPNSLPGPGNVLYYEVLVGDCGDSVRDLFEDCDDGNLNDGDGCSAECERQWNVLLIIADDLGVDVTPIYADEDGDGLPDLFLDNFAGPLHYSKEELAATGATDRAASPKPKFLPTVAT